jgi:hypothetical protein
VCHQSEVVVGGSQRLAINDQVSAAGSRAVSCRRRNSSSNERGTCQRLLAFHQLILATDNAFDPIGAMWRAPGRVKSFTQRHRSAESGRSEMAMVAKRWLLGHPRASAPLGVVGLWRCVTGVAICRVDPTRLVPLPSVNLDYAERTSALFVAENGNSVGPFKNRFLISGTRSVMTLRKTVGSTQSGSGLDRRTALRLGMATIPFAATLAIPRVAAAASVPALGTYHVADVTAAVERSQLIPGTYLPSRATTGRTKGAPPITKIVADIKATHDGQVFTDLELWGSIDLGEFRNVVVRNCIIRGTAVTGKDTSFVHGSGDDNRGLLIEDSVLAGRGNIWCSAMRGGNYTIRRTELTWIPDGLCLTSPLGNVTAEGCWIHNGMYKEWTASTLNMPRSNGYYSHTDGVQFHRGKNYVLRGNMIGGVRAPAKHHTLGSSVAINSADDMYNACLMIKQEVDASAANKIENVLIENNWFMGGAASINLTAGRGNTFSSTIVRNNRFIRSTWGRQYYILRTPGSGQFLNNVFDDDSSPVPISRGA